MPKLFTCRMVTLALAAGDVGAATFAMDVVTDAVDALVGDGVCETAAGDCTPRASVQGASALAGAGIINRSVGTVKVIRSTVHTNVANRNGGGIFNFGTLELENSTVSGNRAGENLGTAGYGGGVYNVAQSSDGVVRLRSTTFAENYVIGAGGGFGGSVYSKGGSVTFGNTIFVSPSEDAECAGTGSFVSEGFNIEDGSNTCSLGAIGDQPNTSTFLTGPIIGPGEETATHRPVLGLSPSIDAGNPAGCPGLGGVALRIDQRGVSRPRDGDEDGTPTCDVGAVEVPEPGGGALGLAALAPLSWLASRRRRPDGYRSTRALRLGSALVALLLLPVGAARAGTLPEVWGVALDGPDSRNDYARDVAVDGFGGVIAVGSEVSATGGGSLVATRRDAATGAELWTVTIGPYSSGGQAVAVDAAGDVFVAGSILNDFGVVKLARENGSELWRKRLDGSARFATDVAYAVAVDGAGNVVAAGLLENEASGPDFAVVGLDGASGAERWRYVRDGTRPGDLNDRAVAVALSDEGEVYAAGGTETDGAGSDWYVVALAGANGAFQWSRTIDGSYAGSELEERVLDLCVTAGGLYAVGELRNGNGTDFGVFYLDRDTGATIWDRQLDGSVGASDSANAVTADTLGNAIVAGRLDVEGTRQDFAVVRLGVIGGLTSWTFLLDGGAGGFDDATSIALDPAGGTVLVAGSLDRVETDRGFDVLALGLAGGRLLGQYVAEGSGESAGISDRARAVAAMADRSAVAVGQLVNAESGMDLFVARVPEGSRSLMGAASCAALVLLARRRVRRVRWGRNGSARQSNDPTTLLALLAARARPLGPLGSRAQPGIDMDPVVGPKTPLVIPLVRMRVSLRSVAVTFRHSRRSAIDTRSSSVRLATGIAAVSGSGARLERALPKAHFSPVLVSLAADAGASDRAEAGVCAP